MTELSEIQEFIDKEEMFSIAGVYGIKILEDLGDIIIGMVLQYPLI